MNTDVMDLLARRRTIRRYSGEEISDQDLAPLIEAAFYAPSYLNRRPMHLVIVRDKQVQEQLGSILSVRPYVQEASAVFALLGDPQISNTWEIDLAAAAENLLIAATGLGLGAAWVGNPHGAAWSSRVAEVRKLLAIPEHLGVLGFIAVGHPDEEKKPHSRAADWDTTRVHFNGFSQLDPAWARH